MNGASVAYGLRAALAVHEGTALHRFAVEALDGFARLSATAHDILMSLPPEERPALITEHGEAVMADAKAFAAGWTGYPEGGPPDVMVVDEPQLDLEPRFYWVDEWHNDRLDRDDLTWRALKRVGDGHAVLHVEGMVRRPDATPEKPLGTYDITGVRLYVDRRPGGRP